MNLVARPTVRLCSVQCNASEKVNKVKKQVRGFGTKVHEIRARRLQRFKQVLPLWEESFLKDVDELEQAVKDVFKNDMEEEIEDPFKKE